MPIQINLDAKSQIKVNFELLMKMLARLSEIDTGIKEVIMSIGNQRHTQYSTNEELDEEWAKLISEALRIGITKDEIREFLINNESIKKLDHFF